MMGRFQKDDRVSHARYGAGVVVDANERYTTIAFDDDVVRKFVSRLVQLQRSNLPLPVKPTPAPRRHRRNRPRIVASASEHYET
jgi:hypothetical protein